VVVDAHVQTSSLTSMLDVSALDAHSQRVDRAPEELRCFCERCPASLLQSRDLVASDVDSDLVNALVERSEQLGRERSDERVVPFAHVVVLSVL
jgi:hypothetical protein